MMPDRCQQPQPGRSQIQKKKALKSLMLSFKTAQTGISRNDQDRVARMARYLRNHPETVALVEGYADSVGPFDYNLTLSRVRTLSVRNHLMQQGEIDGGRISVAVYGCKPPAAGTGGGKKRPESGSGVILITLTRGAPASP
jgi:OOP family OmpA-OmpF porin